MKKAKRKKNKEVIVIDKELKLSEDSIDTYPDCYGEKDSYCKKEFCGEWFESCIKK